MRASESPSYGDRVSYRTRGSDMHRQDELSYHSERATRELDLGLTAGSSMAARAHLELASMHMQRVRQLSTRPVASPIFD